MGIVITEVEVESKKIKKDYTICLLADIHNTKYSNKKVWSILVEQIKKIEPNFILMAGDVVYSADDLMENDTKEKLDYLLTSLCDLAPIFITYGNHDLKNGKRFSNTETLKYFENFQKNNSNFHILNNSSYQYEDINIYGVVPVFEAYYFQFQKYWETYFIEAILKNNEIKDRNDSSLNIVLTHSPLVLENMQKFFGEKPEIDKQKLEFVKSFLETIDLFACGHMHDGLIPKHWQKLGIIKDDNGIMASEGENIKKATLKKVKLCRGLHTILKGKLVITGGITKWCQPNLVFGIIDKVCAKDITTLKLVKKK